MPDQSTLVVRHVRELARHMAWADATVWSAVISAPEQSIEGGFSLTSRPGFGTALEVVLRA